MVLPFDEKRRRNRAAVRKFAKSPKGQQYFAQWNADNNERRRQYQRNARQRSARIIREAKDRPCADCGQWYPYYVMDFDHRDPESKAFGIGTATNRSEEALRAEMEKCDVVCANCHRERTHRQRAAAKAA